MTPRPSTLCRLAARLGDRLRRLRGDETLLQFSKKVGLSKSTLARVEQGTQNLTLESLQSICDHLHCDIADLFSPRSKPAVADRHQPGEEDRP